MKVVHLVTFDDGGAYKAAKRISDALMENAESTLITYKNIPMSTFDKVIQRILKRFYLMYPFKVRKLKYFYNTDLESSSVLEMKLVKDADIIHLHWVTDGLISLKSIKKLKQMNKPIVWTLHDMHPFTGGCHYTGICEKYKDRCGFCYQLDSNKMKDFSTWNQEKKQEYLQGLNMVAVGCSNWITQCASESTIMKSLKCVSIPNCIETDIYKPCDRAFARARLNIEIKEKKLIAFGAMNSTSDKRKGFVYLKEALEKLDKEQYACLILGGNGEKIDGMQTISINHLTDDYSLALFYAAADVFVAPSVQENLANTVVEALSSGTPVVAFDIGGMPDMVIPKYNGYLAKPFDTKDLMKGIEFCCQHEEMGQNAREYAVEHYQFKNVAEQYMEIYNALLTKSGAKKYEG